MKARYRAAMLNYRCLRCLIEFDFEFDQAPTPDSRYSIDGEFFFSPAFVVAQTGEGFDVCWYHKISFFFWSGESYLTNLILRWTGEPTSPPTLDDIKNFARRLIEEIAAVEAKRKEKWSRKP